MLFHIPWFLVSEMPGDLARGHVIDEFKYIVDKSATTRHGVFQLIMNAPFHKAAPFLSPVIHTVSGGGLLVCGRAVFAAAPHHNWQVVGLKRDRWLVHKCYVANRRGFIRPERALAVLD